MTILAGVLAGVAVLVAFVLASPVKVDVHLHARVHEQTATVATRTQIGWLLWRWEPSASGGRRGRTRRRRPPRPRARGRPPASRRTLHAGSSVLRTRGFVRAVIRLARRLVSLALPRSAQVTCRVGLEDPASTGRLIGAFGTVSGLAAARNWHVRIEPEFEAPVLAATATLHWSVRPAAVAAPAVGFLCTPAVWRAGCAAVREGRRTRRRSGNVMKNVVTRKKDEGGKSVRPGRRARRDGGRSDAASARRGEV